MPLNNGFLWDGANCVGSHKNRITIIRQMVFTRHTKRRMHENVTFVLKILQLFSSFNFFCVHFTTIGTFFVICMEDVSLFPLMQHKSRTASTGKDGWKTIHAASTDIV